MTAAFNLLSTIAARPIYPGPGVGIGQAPFLARLRRALTLRARPFIALFHRPDG